MHTNYLVPVNRKAVDVIAGRLSCVALLSHCIRECTWGSYMFQLSNQPCSQWAEGTIAGGGVVPHIHKSLVKKSTKECQFSQPQTLKPFLVQFTFSLSRDAEEELIAYFRCCRTLCLGTLYFFLESMDAAFIFFPLQCYQNNLISILLNDSFFFF